MSSTEIVIPEVIDSTPMVAGLYPNDPSSMVALATAQATELSQIIEKQKLYASISGKKHVTVEGWTTLGAMLGVFPVVVWSRELTDEDGNNNGWEARVEARTLAGQVVGAAEAECRRTERTWKSRDSYSLRSMAQTRATSKALRLPLGFIMAIAGYEATPTDEFDKGAINQAKAEVLTICDGDTTTARELWAAALTEHEITDDKEIKVEQLEGLITYAREVMEATNAEA